MQYTVVYCWLLCCLTNLIISKSTASASHRPFPLFFFALVFTTCPVVMRVYLCTYLSISFLCLVELFIFPKDVAVSLCPYELYSIKYKNRPLQQRNGGEQGEKKNNKVNERKPWSLSLSSTRSFSGGHQQKKTKLFLTPPSPEIPTNQTQQPLTHARKRMPAKRKTTVSSRGGGSAKEKTSRTKPTQQTSKLLEKSSLKRTASGGSTVGTRNTRGVVRKGRGQRHDEEEEEERNNAQSKTIESDDKKEDKDSSFSSFSPSSSSSSQASSDEGTSSPEDSSCDEARRPKARRKRSGAVAVNKKRDTCGGGRQGVKASDHQITKGRDSSDSDDDSVSSFTKRLAAATALRRQSSLLAMQEEEEHQRQQQRQVKKKQTHKNKNVKKQNRKSGGAREKQHGADDDDDAQGEKKANYPFSSGKAEVEEVGGGFFGNSGGRGSNTDNSNNSGYRGGEKAKRGAAEKKRDHGTIVAVDVHVDEDNDDDEPPPPAVTRKRKSTSMARTTAQPKGSSSFGVHQKGKEEKYVDDEVSLSHRDAVSLSICRQAAERPPPSPGTLWVALDDDDEDCGGVVAVAEDGGLVVIENSSSAAASHESDVLLPQLSEGSSRQWTPQITNEPNLFLCNSEFLLAHPSANEQQQKFMIPRRKQQEEQPQQQQQQPKQGGTSSPSPSSSIALPLPSFAFCAFPETPHSPQIRGGGGRGAVLGIRKENKPNGTTHTIINNNNFTPHHHPVETMPSMTHYSGGVGTDLGVRAAAAINTAEERSPSLQCPPPTPAFQQQLTTRPTEQDEEVLASFPLLNGPFATTRGPSPAYSSSTSEQRNRREEAPTAVSSSLKRQPSTALHIRGGRGGGGGGQQGGGGGSDISADRTGAPHPFPLDAQALALTQPLLPPAEEGRREPAECLHRYYYDHPYPPQSGSAAASSVSNTHTNTNSSSLSLIRKSRSDGDGSVRGVGVVSGRGSGVGSRRVPPPPQQPHPLADPSSVTADSSLFTVVVGGVGGGGTTASRRSTSRATSVASTSSCFAVGGAAGSSSFLKSSSVAGGLGGIISRRNPSVSVVSARARSEESTGGTLVFGTGRGGTTSLSRSRSRYYGSDNNNNNTCILRPTTLMLPPPPDTPSLSAQGGTDNRCDSETRSSLSRRTTLDLIVKVSSSGGGAGVVETPPSANGNAMNSNGLARVKSFSSSPPSFHHQTQTTTAPYRSRQRQGNAQVVGDGHRGVKDGEGAGNEDMLLPLPLPPLPQFTTAINYTTDDNANTNNTNNNNNTSTYSPLSLTQPPPPSTPTPPPPQTPLSITLEGSAVTNASSPLLRYEEGEKEIKKIQSNKEEEDSNDDEAKKNGDEELQKKKYYPIFSLPLPTVTAASFGSSNVGFQSARPPPPPPLASRAPTRMTTNNLMLPLTQPTNSSTCSSSGSTNTQKRVGSGRFGPDVVVVDLVSDDDDDNDANDAGMVRETNLTLLGDPTVPLLQEAALGGVSLGVGVNERRSAVVISQGGPGAGGSTTAVAAATATTNSNHFIDATNYHTADSSTPSNGIMVTGSNDGCTDTKNAFIASDDTPYCSHHKIGLKRVRSESSTENNNTSNVSAAAGLIYGGVGGDRAETNGIEDERAGQEKKSTASRNLHDRTNHRRLLHTSNERRPVEEALDGLFPTEFTQKQYLRDAQRIIEKENCLKRGDFWKAIAEAEYVGEGSFGLVWRCRTVEGDVVAVKTCPVSFSEPAAIDDAYSLLREVAIMRLLNKERVPYVLPLHAAFLCVGEGEALPPEVFAMLEMKEELADLKEKLKASEVSMKRVITSTENKIRRALITKISQLKKKEKEQQKKNSSTSSKITKKEELLLRKGSSNAKSEARKETSNSGNKKKLNRNSKKMSLAAPKGRKGATASAILNRKSSLQRNRSSTRSSNNNTCSERDSSSDDDDVDYNNTRATDEEDDVEDLLALRDPKSEAFASKLSSLVDADIDVAKVRDKHEKDLLAVARLEESIQQAMVTRRRKSAAPTTTLATTASAATSSSPPLLSLPPLRLPKFNAIDRYSAMHCDATLFLVVDICDGDLDDIDKKNEAVAKRVAYCISTALAAIHRLGLVHLDLKPANILYSLDVGGGSGGGGVGGGGGAVIKFVLSDFGNCQIVGRSYFDTVEQAIGTYEYMDFEAVSERVCSRATDCFSLGCTLYELLTGRRYVRLSEAVCGQKGEGNGRGGRRGGRGGAAAKIKTCDGETHSPSTCYAPLFSRKLLPDYVTVLGQLKQQAAAASASTSETVGGVAAENAGLRSPTCTSVINANPNLSSNSSNSKVVSLEILSSIVEELLCVDRSKRMTAMACQQRLVEDYGVSSMPSTVSLPQPTSASSQL